MDIAGLTIGIVTAWKTCVDVLDIFDSAKKYGMDYEVLHVKLEVERIRLLTWGDAVGLDKVENGLDSRLNRDETHRTVLRLLGCIQQIFEHTDRLQEKYGLRPVTHSIQVDDEGPPTQSQLILGPIFKRAAETLRELAQRRQRGTALKRKTIWAIHDKKKFQEMVIEIKGFNDSLHSLFPDIQSRTTDAIRKDINRSDDVNALQSLQEATTNEHEDISETASTRLEAIGATTGTRSDISGQYSDGDTTTGQTNTGPRPGVNTQTDSGANTESDASEEFDVISKQMEEVDLYVSKKSEGALTLNLIGPHSYSAKVSARVYWDGDKSDDTWSHWDDERKGFLESSHASFGLYYRKRYVKTISRKDNYNTDTYEDAILFDVESNSKYENINPGTVTVEGFGMECWDYELNFGKIRKDPIMVSARDLPGVPASSLLRRIDELRRGNFKFGWNRAQEDADLKEFFGDMGITRYRTDRGDSYRIGDFFSLLNRRDVFADLTTAPSIALQWAGPKEVNIGMWNFLWQIILAKELAMRLEVPSNWYSAGFTPRIQAVLIIQDLWLSNVEIILEDAIILPDEMQKPQTLEEKNRAEKFKSKGNDAMQRNQWQDAVDFYAVAMKLDPSNAVYHSNRSAAFLSMDKYEEARHDAYIAAQLDPKYAKAWSRLGLAEMKLGNGKKARDAYERAIEIAGKDATKLMEQGLDNAKTKIKADIKAIEEEEDHAAKDVLRKNFLDQDWDIACKSLQLHSCVHEQQVEGLLLFAERMRWPYINETRDYAEDVYGNLRSGQTIPLDLHDWLFGMTLPGKWMSRKIMTALVLCTPSLSVSLGIAHYYDCGLSLPRKSYWRVRTVLGRVLGCLPDLLSLCGWIGPCPPVEFVPFLPGEAQKEPRYIRLKSRRVAPIEYTPDSEDGVIYVGGKDRYKATRMQPDEDLSAYIIEMKDPGNWVIPEPPVREVCTCTIQSIRLKKLPPDVNVAAKKANKELSDKEVDESSEYRASIVFIVDNNEEPIEYRLYTNPVFVTPPPCRSRRAGVTKGGIHEVHVREISMYLENIWTVDRLKHHTPEDFNEDVMIINATGKGTEALARAWCSERGKNAVIRRAGGPCFVCATRAASKTGLGVGVLIWVSSN